MTLVPEGWLCSSRAELTASFTRSIWRKAGTSAKKSILADSLLEAVLFTISRKMDRVIAQRVTEVIAVAVAARGASNRRLVHQRCHQPKGQEFCWFPYRRTAFDLASLQFQLGYLDDEAFSPTLPSTTIFSFLSNGTHCQKCQCPKRLCIVVNGWPDYSVAGTAKTFNTIYRSKTRHLVSKAVLKTSVTLTSSISYATLVFVRQFSKHVVFGQCRNIMFLLSGLLG